jgi:hypothetical protein
MEQNPNGSYEPLYLYVKELQTKLEFSVNNVNEYRYEVLGGMHNVLATKELPENIQIRKFSKNDMPSCLLSSLMKIHCCWHPGLTLLHVFVIKAGFPLAISFVRSDFFRRCACTLRNYVLRAIRQSKE